MIVAAFQSVFFGGKVVAVYYGPAIFLNVLHEERGWPVSIISGAITVHFLVSAVFVARLPDAHRRFGIATTTQAGVATLVIGMLFWSLAGEPWQLFIAATLSGAGWAATSGAPIIAMVSPWFERRRALALGHALNGASVGGAVFAPLWVMLIASIGFTKAVAVIGCGTVAVTLATGFAISASNPQQPGAGPRWRRCAH